MLTVSVKRLVFGISRHKQGCWLHMLKAAQMHASLLTTQQYKPAEYAVALHTARGMGQR